MDCARGRERFLFPLFLQTEPKAPHSPLKCQVSLPAPKSQASALSRPPLSCVQNHFAHTAGLELAFGGCLGHLFWAVTERNNL